MLEPDVTLTDYVLAAQGLVFAVYLHRKGAAAAWQLLFAALCVASLAGGSVHGFFPTGSSAVGRVLWPVTLIAIGAATMAIWLVSLPFLDSERARKLVRWIAVVQFAAFTLFVLFGSQDFLWTALNYIPPSIFFLVVLVRAYLATRTRAILWAVIGMILTFVAAGVQIGGISIHPVYFNHNAAYHAIQFVALALIFITARWTITRRGQAEGPRFTDTRSAPI